VAEPILVLTQGYAGDRLGAALAPALLRRFPDRPLHGTGGARMAEAGVRVVARTDRISAMGYSGLLPTLPRTLLTLLETRLRTGSPCPACVVAVDIWQPLRFLHRAAPHLAELPHVCYLPPSPNLIGACRVHAAASAAFTALVAPFKHQEVLYSAAGARVVPGAHAGLEAARREASPYPAEAREPILALVPGSRALEIRFSLPIQLEAARRIQSRHPSLRPVVCCVDGDLERWVARRFPAVGTTTRTRETLAQARLGLICSGTAVLEAAVLGCPGVVTYHGSRLQRWEWERFHVPGLARLRAAGIASPYLALPNIISGRELYAEHLNGTPLAIADAALVLLEQEPAALRPPLDAVAAQLNWNDAGEAVADQVAGVL
jgi:lipid-A-disaccharide synthase